MKKILYTLFIYLIICWPALSNKPQEHILPNFDTAMYGAKMYKDAYQKILENPSEASFIAQVRQKYNALIDLWPWQEMPKIPKIIHQIWVGPNNLPATFKKWQKTWLTMHPEWEYRLWTDTEVTQLQLTNQEYYDTTKSYGEKANILRYEILYQFGGVYLDTDFECIKPLDFVHHVCDFYVGLEFPQPNKDYFIVGNAILGARPGHPLIKLFIDKMKYYWHNSWQPKRSGTFYITDIIKRNIHKLEGIAIVFPSNFFYPWSDSKKPWEERTSSYRTTSSPESLGFHHWDLSWQN